MPIPEVKRESEFNVLALQKNGSVEDRYIFLYDDDSTTELLRVLGRFAANRELSFTFYDAAVLGARMRAMKHEKPR